MSSAILASAQQQLQTVLQQERDENDALRRQLRLIDDKRSFLEKTSFLCGDSLPSSRGYSRVVDILTSVEQNLSVKAFVFCVVNYTSSGTSVSESGWSLCCRTLSRLEPLYFEGSLRRNLLGDGRYASEILSVPSESSLIEAIIKTFVAADASVSHLDNLMCIASQPIGSDDKRPVCVYWFVQCDLELHAAVTSRLLALSAPPPAEIMSRASLLSLASTALSRAAIESMTSENIECSEKLRSVNVAVASAFLQRQKSDEFDLESDLQLWEDAADLFENMLPLNTTSSCKIYIVSLSGGFLLSSSMTLHPLSDKSCKDLFEVDKSTLIEAIVSKAPIICHRKDEVSSNSSATFHLWFSDTTDLVYSCLVHYKFNGILSDYDTVPIQREVFAVSGPAMKLFVDSHMENFFDPLWLRMNSSAFLSLKSRRNSFSSHSENTPIFNTESQWILNALDITLKQLIHDGRCLSHIF